MLVLPSKSLALALLIAPVLSACHHTHDTVPSAPPPFLKTSGLSTESQDQEASTESSKSVPVVQVVARRLDHSIDLPGELKAYQDVAIHAKVEGFVSSIGVDRGSIVRKGEKLMTISCPELQERIEEAVAKWSSAVSALRRSQAAIEAQKANLVEVQAKLDADKLTLSRLQQAAQTPGAIAQNEIDVQQKTVEADQARYKSVQNEVKAAQAVAEAEKSNVEAAKNVVESQKVMRAYLTIVAPFEGVITERNVHEGSIVAVDPGRNSLPLVRLQERDLLRLVVAVPESCVSGLRLGQDVPFTVPAFLGRTFTAKVARLGYALDQQTRTMPVELNAWNKTQELEPGMFATVHWDVTRPYDTLFVPSSAVTSDLKGTFVDVVRGGAVERIPVERGQPMQDLVEVVGAIKPGDMVVLKASDDLKNGTHIATRSATEKEITKSSKQQTAGGD